MAAKARSDWQMSSDLPRPSATAAVHRLACAVWHDRTRVLRHLGRRLRFHENCPATGPAVSVPGHNDLPTPHRVPRSPHWKSPLVEELSQRSRRRLLQNLPATGRIRHTAAGLASLPTTPTRLSRQIVVLRVNSSL